MMLLKKVCSASTLHLTDYSLNRTAANQIVRGRWVNDGALGTIPKIIIFGYKDDAVSTTNGLQLAKHAERKLQMEEQQFPTLFDI
jgi:hypothetical protein